MNWYELLYKEFNDFEFINTDGLRFYVNNGIINEAQYSNIINHK